MQHRGAQKGNGLPQSKRGKLGGSAGTKVSVLWLAFQERVLAFSVAPGRSWKRAAFRGERWLKCFPCPADVTALPGNDLWFYFFSTLHQIAFHLYFSCCISVGPSVVERDGRRSIDGLKTLLSLLSTAVFAFWVWVTMKSGVKLPLAKSLRTEHQDTARLASTRGNSRPARRSPPTEPGQIRQQISAELI